MSVAAVGICLLVMVMGSVLMVFHRRLARQTAVSYQNSREKCEKMFTWTALLCGVLWSGIGIVLLFADQWVGLPVVFVGLLWIAFEKQWARRTLAFQESERCQRVVTFLVGLSFFIVGLVIMIVRR